MFSPELYLSSLSLGSWGLLGLRAKTLSSSCGGKAAKGRRQALEASRDLLGHPRSRRVSLRLMLSMTFSIEVVFFEALGVSWGTILEHVFRAKGLPKATLATWRATVEARKGSKVSPNTTPLSPIDPRGGGYLKKTCKYIELYATVYNSLCRFPMSPLYTTLMPTLYATIDKFDECWRDSLYAAL